MSQIRFERVSKHYGDVVALHELDLDIQSGEFVSLLGPSGSGKTTTLNLLAGLTRPSEGEIYVDGAPVSHLSPDKRDLAMVFQNFALYPHMTVYENLAFPLKARRRRFGAEVIEQKVAAVSEPLGIASLLHRYPKELSGGQQQRVALGRALVRDPGVFLLDEPLSNLDARLRIRMRLDLKDLHERIGSTVVYVTHDQEEAMTLSSRVAVFDSGHLQQVGTPSEIYNQPVNAFVANFVGDREINFMDGHVRIERERVRFDSKGASLDLGNPRRFARPALEGRYRIGIRPEVIRIVQGGESNAIAGEVVQTELTGAEQILHVRLEDGTAISCKVEAKEGREKGASVTLHFPQDTLYLFDSETGECLNDYSPASAVHNREEASR